MVIDAVVEANEASEACTVASEEGDDVLALPEADTPERFVLFARPTAFPTSSSAGWTTWRRRWHPGPAEGVLGVTESAISPERYWTPVGCGRWGS